MPASNLFRIDSTRVCYISEQRQLQVMFGGVLFYQIRSVVIFSDSVLSPIEFVSVGKIVGVS